eukprot:tig00000946_g5563.t1
MVQGTAAAQGLAKGTVFPSLATGLVASFLGGAARIKVQLNGQEAAKALQGRLRLLTRNVCSFTDAKRSALPRMAEAYGLDAVALQEINLPCLRGGRPNQWEKMLNAGDEKGIGPYFTSGPPADKEGARHKKGALLWISRRWHPYAKVTHRIPGRLVAVKLELPNFRQVHLVSVYVPPDKNENAQTKADYEQIMKTLQELDEQVDLDPYPQPLIVMGDLNSVAERTKDRISAGRWATPAGADHYAEDLWARVEEWGWKDTYRVAQPNAKEVTYIRGSTEGVPDEIETGSRIDVILLNGPAATDGLRAGIEVERANEYMESDHLPMMADIDLTANLRMFGPGAIKHKDRPPRYNFKSLYGPGEAKKEARAEYYGILEEYLKPVLDKCKKIERPKSEEEWRALSEAAKQKLIKAADEAYKELAEETGRAAVEVGCAEIFSARDPDKPPTIARRHNMSLKMRKLRRAWHRLQPEVRLARLQAVSTSLPAGPLPQPRAPMAEWQYWHEALGAAINRLRREIPKEYKKLKTKKRAEYRDKTREWFKTDPGRYWQATMGKSTGIVPFETLVEEVPDHKRPQVLADAPSVRGRLKEYFEEYWGKRDPKIDQTLKEKRLWKHMYKTKTHLKYEGAMDAPRWAEYNEKRRTLKPTAPGDSNLQNSQIKSWPGESAPNELLYLIICDAVRLRRTPDSWNKATTVGISKIPTWDGKLTNDMLVKQGALKGQNSGFLKGKTTEDPLFILQGILEDAHQYDKELYVILQDIRRAYDTVSWESMELAFRRLNIPEEYIELHRFSHMNNRTKIRTVHGTTEEFRREVGLAQGAVEAPLHWLIFYDPLLHAQDFVANKMGGTLGPYEMNQGIAKVTHTAFADDTHWIAKSREGIVERARLASDFCDMHDIEISAEKTRYVTRNSKSSPKYGPTMNAPEIGKEGKQIKRTMSENDPLKVLGVFMTVDLDSRPQIDYMKEKLRATEAVLRTKTVYEEESVYLVNTLVQGFLRYAVKMAKLSDADVDELERTWRSVVKHHAELSKSVPNDMMTSPAPYGLFNLRALQLEEQLTTLLAQLRDTNSLVGKVRMERLLALKEAMGTNLNPLEQTELARYLQKEHLMAHTIHSHVPSRDYAKMAPHLMERDSSK